MAGSDAEAVTNHSDLASQLQIRVLGPLEIAWGGHPVDLGGLKARALVARLLIDRGLIVSVDRLIDSLWGDHEGDGPEIALRSTISRLRKRLREAGVPEDLIVTRSPGLRPRGRRGDDGRVRVRTDGGGRQAAAGTAPAERGGAGARRGAEPLARGRVHRGPRRTVRPSGGAAARGDAARGDRAASRCRLHPRTPRVAHRRAGDADDTTPHARAPVVPAHARALSLGAAGGGAARLSGPSFDPGGRARASSPGTTCRGWSTPS